MLHCNTRVLGILISRTLRLHKQPQVSNRWMVRYVIEADRIRHRNATSRWGNVQDSTLVKNTWARLLPSMGPLARTFRTSSPSTGWPPLPLTSWTALRHRAGLPRTGLRSAAAALRAAPPPRTPWSSTSAADSLPRSVIPGPASRQDLMCFALP